MATKSVGVERILQERGIAEWSRADGERVLEALRVGELKGDERSVTLDHIESFRFFVLARSLRRPE